LKKIILLFILGLMACIGISGCGKQKEISLKKEMANVETAEKHIYDEKTEKENNSIELDERTQKIITDLEEKYDDQFEYLGKRIWNGEEYIQLKSIKYPNEIIEAYDLLTGECDYITNYQTFVLQNEIDEKIENVVHSLYKDAFVYRCWPEYGDILYHVENPEAYTIDDYFQDVEPQRIIIMYDDLTEDEMKQLGELFAENKISITAATLFTNDDIIPGTITKENFSEYYEDDSWYKTCYMIGSRCSGMNEYTSITPMDYGHEWKEHMIIQYPLWTDK